MALKNVSTNELISNLAQNFDGVTKKMVKEMVTCLFSEIEASLVQGKKIRLDKLGIFQVKERAARMGRNPQTGEEIRIPASKKVGFRAAKSLKDQVTGGRKSSKSVKSPAKKAKKK